ncbi:MAG: PHP domain-containing protein [Spirochaetes bacterium]|nr:PHP domain-containing protein [Spirochaetota bacterium]
MIDLHCHTNASDGAFSPYELVKKAFQTGITTLAITDHDTVSGIPSAIEAGKEYQMEIIPGIEISCNFENIQSEIHLVGLFIDDQNEELLRLLVQLRKFRYQRNHSYLEKLKQLGIPVSLEELGQELTHADQNNILNKLGKPNFARVLVKKGYAANQMEAVKKYFDDDHGLAKVRKETIDLSEALKNIHHAKGLAILAHPHILINELGKFTAFAAVFQKMIEIGIDGIEVYYNHYERKLVKDLRRLARKTNMLISGGSDYHNEVFRNAQLGYYGKNKEIPVEILEPIKKAYTNQSS